MRFRYKTYSFAGGLKKVKTRLALTLTAMSLIAGSSGGLALVANNFARATSSTVIVTQDNTQGWYAADQRFGGAVQYVTDTSSPLPSGALQLTTDGNNASKIQYIHNTTTKLSDVAELSYYTKQISGPSVADPSYQLVVCLGGITGITCDGYATLVYEPYWNGTITSGNWQQWDVMSSTANLWSSKTYTNGSCSVTNGAGGPPFTTIGSLKANCPDAIVVGFGVDVGTYNLNYKVETDGVNFNGTVYDFEFATPTITSPANGSVLTTAHLTKIDWSDVTSPNTPVTYQYRASSDAGYSSTVYTSGWLSASEISTPGTPAGAYYVQVRAQDSLGNISAWSNDASKPYVIYVDNTAPVVAITNPLNGSTVQDTVDVKGTVTDAHPDHYYAVVKNSSSAVIAGPGVVNDTNSFTGQHLFNWNTKLVPNGSYVVDLEARDAAGNKDAGSVATAAVKVHNVPQNKADCKNEHWKFYPDMFKNQGQCVEYVEHHNNVGKDDDHARINWTSYFKHWHFSFHF